MPPVQRDDPYGNFNFKVAVSDIAEDGSEVSASFTEVSGLEAQIGVIEYRNGSEDITPRKLPGLVKYSNLVLKRGITGDLAFWRWVLSSVNGEVDRKSMTVTLLDENRNEVLKWTFRRAWPCRWTGPGLNASSNEVAMETIEIAHEGLRIDGDG